MTCCVTTGALAAQRCAGRPSTSSPLRTMRLQRFGSRVVTPAVACADSAVDVVALSNLCVDVVVNVDELPSSCTQARKALLERLANERTARESWEVGGNTNYLIAASRIGLQAACAGHLGSDDYGEFMTKVLLREGVLQVVDVAESMGPDSTLICYVLVDPEGSHSFVSRYDFGPFPLLGSVDRLPPASTTLISKASALWTNGFTFDELPPQTVLRACEEARGLGTSVLFDPGPRVWSMREGERKEALEGMLSVADVVLVTEEEGQAITGSLTAQGIAKELIRGAAAGATWVVVKQGGDGATMAVAGERETLWLPGYAVPVADTVGCGDSFGAAITMGFIRGCREDVTLTLANAVGAATAMGRGAGRQVATAGGVARILRDQARGAAGRGALELVQGALGAPVGGGHG